MATDADAEGMPRRVTETTCRVEGCDRPRKRVGPRGHSVWCAAHLSRKRKFGDLRESLPVGSHAIESDVCGVEGCGRSRTVVSARGAALRRSRWCSAHARRRTVHGDVMADVPVRETRRSVLLRAEGSR